MYELTLLIALPDEYAWTLRIVRIVFDNNTITARPMPRINSRVTEAVSCRFIVRVSRYSDLAGCDEASLPWQVSYSPRLAAPHSGYHILIVRGEITNCNASDSLLGSRRWREATAE